MGTQSTLVQTAIEWADALLRLFVAPENVDDVSGDLLEEYRDSVLPRSGQRRADRWYVRQVLGFVWRGTGLWAILFGTAFVARTALDWLAPPETFELRSTVSTALGVAILLVAGARAAWRSRPTARSCGSRTSSTPA